MENKQSIFDYTNYRDYLRSYYELHKETGLSYRSMAQRMGFTSPNYLKLIIDGDRHIGRASIDAVIEGLGLKKVEGEYFGYLVFFSKAKTEVEKNYLFSHIARLRSGRMITTIADSQFAYYDSWYNPIIRELVVGLPQAELDCAMIARAITPQIHHKQVRQSLGLLEQLGFLCVDEEGLYQFTSPLIHSTDEVSSFAIKEYHKKMIDLAKASLDTQQREERDISCVTLKVSEKGRQAIKERIQAFRKELLQIAHDDQQEDQVAQINIQLFKVSEQI